jgi:hypothetical protein
MRDKMLGDLEYGRDFAKVSYVMRLWAPLRPKRLRADCLVLHTLSSVSE